MITKKRIVIMFLCLCIGAAVAWLISASVNINDLSEGYRLGREQGYAEGLNDRPTNDVSKAWEFGFKGTAWPVGKELKSTMVKVDTLMTFKLDGAATIHPGDFICMSSSVVGAAHDNGDVPCKTTWIGNAGYKNGNDCFDGLADCVDESPHTKSEINQTSTGDCSPNISGDGKPCPTK